MHQLFTDIANCVITSQRSNAGPGEIYFWITTTAVRAKGKGRETWNQIPSEGHS
jgi:hypothetical protein